MKDKKRILVCPLDWGLGHATRCIPVVRELTLQGCDVIIASSGDALRLLQLEFPLLKCYTLTGYQPRYARHNLALSMLCQLPKFRRAIRLEHDEVDSLITQNSVDLVISDNRYGCWSDRVPSIFICHQLNIQTPFLQGLIREINYSALRKFSAVWIPDFEGSDSLSGALSEHRNLPVKFVGPLSRFKKPDLSSSDPLRYDVVALLSGPEPQRAILESILRAQLQRSGLKTLLVKGKPGGNQEQWEPNATEVDHLASEVLNNVIANAALIVCRPGYSTIMDLSVVGGKAIFIPTPGQTEQEYLASLLMKKGICLSVWQKNFNLTDAMKASKSYKGFSSMPPHDLLTGAIHSLLS